MRLEGVGQTRAPEPFAHRPASWPLPSPRTLNTQHLRLSVSSDSPHLPGGQETLKHVPSVHPPPPERLPCLSRCLVIYRPTALPVRAGHVTLDASL